MGKPIGIDLGTTNSCVAVIDSGGPVVIPNSEGGRTTPSMVAFTEHGERLVGQIAKRQVLTNPKHTVFAIKRLMGRKFNASELQKIKNIYPFEIISSNNGDAYVRVMGKEYSPTEISAYIVEKMKNTAEDYLGEKVEDAVITVPAYFDDTQRQATKDAGRIAGLNVLRIINEPTAASLAFGLHQHGRGKIAVYDLGGGTFDISILHVSEGIFQVLGTTGDTFLGGEDFDAIIVDHFADQFFAEYNIDLRKEIMALQRLKEAAEKAKFELSTAVETEINLPFIAADESGPKHLNRELTRMELENLVEHLVDRTIKLCDNALKEAGMRKEDLNQVLLVGGMTKMPLVQKKVESYFGQPPNKEVNPDEAVAIGAALQASIIHGEVHDVLLLDVIPLSLGIETAGGVFTKLIEKNTTIPTSHSEVFTTATDNQSLVNVHVLQGERPLCQDNKSLARFQLLGIPPAPRGVPQIEVTFEVDANGILHVSAKDLGTGKSQRIKVNATSGLSELDIKRIIDESEEYRQLDIERKEIAELKVNAEGLIYTTEKSLEEFEEFLSDADREQIRKDLLKCKDALQGDDIQKLRIFMKNLERSAYKIAAAMYEHM